MKLLKIKGIRIMAVMDSEQQVVECFLRVILYLIRYSKLSDTIKEKDKDFSEQKQ